eukprot:UN27642
MDAYLGETNTEWLDTSFSTSSSTDKLASRTTSMNRVKMQYDYHNAKGCGIPYVQIAGEVEDWEKILDRVKLLSIIDLDWWLEALIPVLTELSNAA